LPITIRFPITHEEVGAFQADPLERHAVDVTPKHKGRVAERSPCCQYWQRPKPFLYHVVERHESICVSFGDPILVHADHTLAVN
jgi:hypothetical protein